MIRLFFWTVSLKGKAVGHLSLKLSDGTYVSFWPGEDASEETSSANTYDEDVREEGRPPDYVLELPDGIVDEGKIKRWWSTYVDNNDYDLFRGNCAMAVKEALVEGGIRERSGARRHDFELHVAPKDVYLWAERCKEAFLNGGERRRMVIFDDVYV